MTHPDFDSTSLLECALYGRELIARAADIRGLTPPPCDWSEADKVSPGKPLAIATCMPRWEGVSGQITLSRHVFPLLTHKERCETIAHEVAHLVAGRWDGSRGHDPKWRRWAVRLGAYPRAKHLLCDESQNRLARWAAKTLPSRTLVVCGCQAYALTRSYVKRVVGAGLVCRDCATPYRVEVSNG